MDLTSQQWNSLKHLFPDPPDKQVGRPASPARSIVNGILWVARTGESWKRMPERMANPSTCYSQYYKWLEDGTWDEVLYSLALNLKETAGIDIMENFPGRKFNPNISQVNLFQHLDRIRSTRDWTWYTLMLFLNPYVMNTAKTQGVMIGLERPSEN